MNDNQINIEEHPAYQYVSKLVVKYQEENADLKRKLKELKEDYRRVLINKK